MRGSWTGTNGGEAGRTPTSTLPPSTPPKQMVPHGSAMPPRAAFERSAARRRRVSGRFGVTVFGRGYKVKM